MLARATARIVDEARRYEEAREGAAATRRWASWAAITPERPEWKAALSFAATMWCPHWPGWSVAERTQACQSLLAPFTPDAANLLAFVESVNSRIRAPRAMAMDPWGTDEALGDSEWVGITWLDFDAALEVRLRRPQGGIVVLRFSWVTNVVCTVPFHGGVPLMWEARIVRESQGDWDARFDFGSRGLLSIRCGDVGRRCE